MGQQKSLLPDDSFAELDGETPPHKTSSQKAITREHDEALESEGSQKCEENNSDASNEASNRNKGSDELRSSINNRHPISSELLHPQHQPFNLALTAEEFAFILTWRLLGMIPQERAVQWSCRQSDATSSSVGGGEDERGEFNSSSWMETYLRIYNILVMQSATSSDAHNGLEPARSRSVISEASDSEESVVGEAPRLQKRKSCHENDTDANESSFHGGKKQREEENGSSSDDEDY